MITLSTVHNCPTERKVTNVIMSNVNPIMLQYKSQYHPKLGPTKEKQPRERKQGKRGGAENKTETRSKTPSGGNYHGH